MGRTAKRNPSFFKVLVGDFAVKLRIPDAFVKKFKGIMHQRTVTLKSNMRNSSLISVESSRNGFFFKRGWKLFVRRHNLQEFDFLVFNLADKRTYEVLIFESSGCEKEIKQANDKLTRRGVGGSRPARKIPISSRKRANVRRGRDYQDVIEARSIDRQENSEEYERDKVAEGIMSVTPKHPYFVHFYKDYQKYNLRMPSSFAAATELAKKPSTVIEDPEGRKWPVCITVSCKGDHVYFSSGFHDFTEANGIVSGDTIVFHCRKLGRNVIDAQIHSKGRRSINDGNQKTSKGGVKSEPLVV